MYAIGLQEYRMIFTENMKKSIPVFYILLTVHLVTNSC